MNDNVLCQQCSSASVEKDRNWRLRRHSNYYVVLEEGAEGADDITPEKTKCCRCRAANVQQQKQRPIKPKCCRRLVFD
uniref:Uncharacterized protein n=1 Tax=Lymantria dispar multicapsid nuclear polyhedrosis virus TaxID=10449 RepID=A0A1B1MR69_NPVLD|nr:hypothetical protein [Lymantria dispar multiple nucleopolyhedrovirus]